MYTALVLAFVCMRSPFGWGWTHVPLPEVNMLVSLCFFVAVIAAGFRVVQSWWRVPVPHFLRWSMRLLSTVLLIGVALIAARSLLLQQTSAHNQSFQHMEAVLVALVILAGFALLYWLSGRILKRETPNKRMHP